MARPKKNAATKPVVVSARGGELITEEFMKDLQAEAVADAANAKLMGESNYVSTKGARFSFQGEDWGPTINGVLLTQVHLNAYYDKDYEQDSKGVIPACFALSRSGESMAPHEVSGSKQSETCEGCWAYELGTAKVGKSSACKKGWRVMFIREDDVGSAESAAQAPILHTRVPQTSKNNLTAYINVLAQNPRFKMPVFAVLTKFILEPSKWQFAFRFEPIEVLRDAALIRVLQSRARTEAVDIGMAPFRRSSTKDEPSDPKSGKPDPAKRKAAVAAPKSATRGGRSRFG